VTTYLIFFQNPRNPAGVSNVHTAEYWIRYPKTTLSKLAKFCSTAADGILQSLGNFGEVSQRIFRHGLLQPSAMRKVKSNIDEFGVSTIAGLPNSWNLATYSGKLEAR
jgi:hypothetical protein